MPSAGLMEMVWLVMKSSCWQARPGISLDFSIHPPRIPVNAKSDAVITHILFEGSAGSPSACKARWPDFGRQFGGAGRLKSGLLDAFLFCRADSQSAPGSSAPEPDSSIRRVGIDYPHFETHPMPLTHLPFGDDCAMMNIRRSSSPSLVPKLLCSDVSCS